MVKVYTTRFEIKGILHLLLVTLYKSAVTVNPMGDCVRQSFHNV